MLAMVGLAAASSAGSDPIPTRFNGSRSTEWHEWRNWDNGIVPNNTPTEQWAVTIPQWTDAALQWWGTTEVSSLFLEPNADVMVDDGLFRPGVVTFSQESGMYAHGGNIELFTPGGDWRWLNVHSAWGSVVTSNLEQILDCRAVILDASASTVLNFSSLHSIDGDDPDAALSVRAIGGRVDLNGLTTLGVPNGWVADDGGLIEAGAFDTEQVRWINVGQESRISLPGVQRLDRASITIHGDGIIETAPVVSMDDVQYRADEGAVCQFEVGQITAHEGFSTSLTAYGADVSAPNLTRLSLEGSPNLNIEASYGQMSMPQLTEITGPDGRFDVRMVDGSWEVPQLARIEPTSVWRINGGNHAFGPMEMGPVDFFEITGAHVDFAGDMDWTGSTVRAFQTMSFEVDHLVSIDGARFEIGTGAVLAPLIANCAAPGSPWLVHDAGSVLDMSALESLTVPDNGTPMQLEIHVRNGGEFIMGSPTIVTEGDSSIRFRVADEGSSIVLDVEATLLASSSWIVESGGVIETPPGLPITNVRGLELRGGAIRLPGLTSLDNLSIYVRSPTELTIGAPVASLTNTTVKVQSTLWTIPGGSWTWTRPGDATLLTVSSNTVTAPDMQQIIVDPPACDLGGTVLVKAGTRGVVDLSHVQTVHGPQPGSGHVLKIAADRNNSSIDLSGLTQADGVIHLVAANDGAVLKWGADVTVQNDLDSFEGSAAAVGQGGRLVCGGSVRTEGRFDGLSEFSTGTLAFCSSREPVLELTMFDAGEDGSLTGIGMGQLIVGSDECPTRLRLIDEIDNGQAGPGAESESIYVGRTPDFNFVESLRIATGSALVLNGLNLYVFQDNGTPLNTSDLGSPGVRAFPYDRGTIYRVDPSACPADFRAPFGQLDFFDVQEFLGLFSMHNPESDLVSDEMFDFFDVQAFLNSYSEGCP